MQDVLQPAEPAVNAETVLHRIVHLFPSFQGYWERSENCFRADDGSFTLHGVLAEFSHYFREQYRSFTVDSIAELAAFLSAGMTADPDFDNAVATCFLENIAGEDCSVTVEGRMRASLPTSSAPAPNPPNP
jgi:hypothetical protein